MSLQRPCEPLSITAGKSELQEVMKKRLLTPDRQPENKGTNKV